MKRRRILAAGVGLAAAALGLGWGLRRLSAQAPSQDATDPPVDIWRLSFERPEGGEVALADLRGRPLVLNFWATWCPPCVEELPLLDRFQREHRGEGWQVLGLAVDSATPVREFLARRPVAFHIGLAGMDGVTLSRTLGNSSGGLPFSAVFDSRGDKVEGKLGALTWDHLSAWSTRIR
jgi:thiol-disulfide isomerase/thioredoxin